MNHQRGEVYRRGREEGGGEGGGPTTEGDDQVYFVVAVVAGALELDHVDVEGFEEVVSQGREGGREGGKEGGKEGEVVSSLGWEHEREGRHKR